jgi:hypothetical protein
VTFKIKASCLSLKNLRGKRNGFSYLPFSGFIPSPLDVSGHLVLLPFSLKNFLGQLLLNYISVFLKMSQF